MADEQYLKDARKKIVAYYEYLRGDDFYIPYTNIVSVDVKTTRAITSNPRPPAPAAWAAATCSSSSAWW